MTIATNSRRLRYPSASVSDIAKMRSDIVQGRRVYLPNVMREMPLEGVSDLHASVC